MVMSLVRLAIGMVPVSLMAIAFFGFNLWAMGLALAVFFLNLILTSWAIGIFVAGLLLRNGLGAESLAWTFMFLFLPLTTLAYAWAINSRGSVTGLHLVVVVIAVLIDLGLVGGSASRRKRVREDG